jgi:hypothetical protein
MRSATTRRFGGAPESPKVSFISTSSPRAKASSACVPASGIGYCERMAASKAANNCGPFGPYCACAAAVAWMRSTSSSPASLTRCRLNICAGNSRSQDWRILSNTGPVSATELLMTPSTSAVAVCCSSASCVSLNNRVFSMAISAWSRNDSASAMALGLKAFACLLPSTSTPTHSSPRSSGRYSAEFRPSCWCRTCSCGGSSTADQSLTCSMALLRIARDGKLAFGSTGIRCSPGTGARPAGVAMAWGE